MAIQILNGLVYGALLFGLASGLALIFGLRRIVNFAHGSLYMLGAYLGYTVSRTFGFWAGLAAAGAGLLVLGYVLEVIVFRPLQRRDAVTILLVTFGLSLIAEDLALSIWGSDTRSFAEPAALARTLTAFGATFPAYRLLMIAFGAVVALGLLIWLRFSRVGLFIRAASHDPVITAVQGVNTDRVSARVVMVSAALAGMSGVVAGPLVSLAPTMGADILVDSFIVVVVGGLGSLGGAFITAMVLGQINVAGVVFMPELTSLLPFLLMIVVLVWKPTGLAGERV